VLKTNTVNNKLIFANWKMHFRTQDVISFCRNIDQAIKKNNKIKESLVLCPPEIYLYLITLLIPDLKIGAQDVSDAPKDNGAYTGEVSSYMLADLGVKYVIVGHYERRKFYHEDDLKVSLKVINCLKHNITPIVCFGEENIGDDPVEILSSLEQVLHKEISEKQLQAKQIIYAYEPYWAIGSHNFQYDIIEANLNKISNHLNSNKQDNKSLIYGGSVNSQNIATLNSIIPLDGFLVGSASLDVNELLKIVENI
jgi:triosephosphate isomerase